MYKGVVTIESLWNATANLPRFHTQKYDFKTDVLIIGGGIAGLLCGYMLQQNGVDCTIIEAERICSGVTADTTAKITVQHGLIYHKLINKYGIETAQLYFTAQNNALEKFRALNHEVRCDFSEQNAFVYSLRNRVEIENEANALRKIGCSAIFAEKVNLPFHVKGAVCVPRQGQFHPLQFLRHIAKNLKIYEYTRALEIRSSEVTTNRGKILADSIIVTTHFPFIDSHGWYFLKMHQHRSYVLGLQGVPDVNGMYVDAALTGLSFRNADGLLLLGGGGHRTGKKGGNWAQLSDFARTNFPEAKEVFRWGTQDCITLDGLPYVGQYAKNTPNLYVATGFNKWGMTNAMAAATVLTDLILGKDNPCAGIFDPGRRIFHTQLAVNIVHSVLGMITPTTPRCPHLGCALRYNKQERSWDCPCHGSRFSEDGKLLDAPANKDKDIS